MADDSIVVEVAADANASGNELIRNLFVLINFIFKT